LSREWLPSFNPEGVLNVIQATEGNEVVNLSKYMFFNLFGGIIEVLLVVATFHLSISLLFLTKEARKEFEGPSLLRVVLPNLSEIVIRIFTLLRHELFHDKTS